MTTDLNAEMNDLDLEYRDVVKDPNDPVNRELSETIPAKYKDKRPEELVDMHINLEKVLRRQGNELGQLRKLVDTQATLLNNVATNNQPRQQAETKKPDPVTAERLLNDPQGTVQSVVQSDPIVNQNNQRLNNIERALAQEQFTKTNPDYEKDVKDPAFQEWVLASPLRSKLLVSLHSQYDFQSGNELWQLWNEHQEAKSASETARQGRTRQATTVKSGASEQAGKPVYSRAKLAELQTRALNGDPVAKARWEDPEFQKEYISAYREDRIK